MVVTVGGVASSGVNFTVVVPPTISSLSPASGLAGASVTITGTNFGATQGTSTVTFNGTTATVSSWSATSIVAAVPSGATTGNVAVTVGGVASSGASFTVLVAPTISILSPASGAVGTSVTITGTNFGATQGASTVTFNGTTATVSSWTATNIVAAVPAGATTGSVVVTVSGVASSGSNFTVLPTPSITSLSPTNGAAGALVIVTGTNFGSTQGGSAVSFNGIAATPQGWSPNHVTVPVPSGAVTGNVLVTVGGVASNGVLFTVTVAPTITSVTPTASGPGGSITITGNSFGNSQGTGSVWLGSTVASVTQWTNNQIVAQTAASASSGFAAVQQNGLWSNSVPFTVTNATITSVTPSSGLPGTQVTIAGSNFGSSQGSGQVWLGTANAIVQSWSGTQIVATVASSSMTGNTQVLQNGVWSNKIPFTVNIPTITNVNPISGVVGTSVTLTGSGFGNSQGTGSVQLGSINGNVVSWSDTQVIATVATGSVTGIARVQQGGYSSNAVAFTVPISGGSGNTVVPAAFSMIVGETRTIQALDASGQPVSGLTWASSDPTVVSLSIDDPPVLTAVAAGHVTVRGGAGSAHVTVVSSSPPLGSSIWSNFGDGSGISAIVPAVPVPTSPADVFAFQNDFTIQAVASYGSTRWTASNPSAAMPGYQPRAMSDFQGGLVLIESTAALSIVKLDGATGHRYPSYSPTAPSFLANPVTSRSALGRARSRWDCFRGYGYSDRPLSLAFNIVDGGNRSDNRCAEVQCPRKHDWVGAISGSASWSYRGRRWVRLFRLYHPGLSRFGRRNAPPIVAGE